MRGNLSKDPITAQILVGQSDAEYRPVTMSGDATIDENGVVTVTGSGGGVTQITAGTNVTITPSGGTGNVTVNATGGSGDLTGTLTDGVVPIASGTHALEDGPIDVGVTTPNVLTITSSESGGLTIIDTGGTGILITTTDFGTVGIQSNNDVDIAADNTITIDATVTVNVNASTSVVVDSPAIAMPSLPGVGTAGGLYADIDGNLSIGAGGGGTPAGLGIIPTATFSAQDSGFANTSFVGCLQGPTLLQLPATWQAILKLVGGTLMTVGNMVVLRTLHGSAIVIDSTPVTISGVSNPIIAITAPQLIYTDDINLQLDNTHDYYFIVYLTSAAGNAALDIPINGTSWFAAGYANNDITGDTTIPSLTAEFGMMFGAATA